MVPEGYQKYLLKYLVIVTALWSFPQSISAASQPHLLAALHVSVNHKQTCKCSNDLWPSPTVLKGTGRVDITWVFWFGCLVELITAVSLFQLQMWFVLKLTVYISRIPKGWIVCCRVLQLIKTGLRRCVFIDFIIPCHGISHQDFFCFWRYERLWCAVATYSDFSDPQTSSTIIQ